MLKLIEGIKPQRCENRLAIANSPTINYTYIHVPFCHNKSLFFLMPICNFFNQPCTKFLHTGWNEQNHDKAIYKTNRNVTVGSGLQMPP